MIGQTIAHYRILERLGEGGMGVVYRAEDTKLQRPVALKFLPESLRHTPEAREQLLREARAASQLRHPHILTIYAIEESPQGDFLVMEFVEGGTLRSVSKQTTIDQAIAFMLQASEGLAAAHDRGIVHRDIKPENLLIDQNAQVRIADFGLARQRRDDRGQSQSWTMAGTLHYMSPEQITGEALDHRTDIFALGSVFFELCSGRLPFEGDYDMAVMYAILQSAPPPLSEFDPSIPSQLEDIIARSLAKNPADRFPDCHALSAALRGLQNRLAGPARDSKERNALLVGESAAKAGSLPLVNRVREMDALRAGVALALAGHGRTFILTGEAGIGKTRVGEAAAAYARETGMANLFGRCLPDGGGLPFHPYTSAIRSGLPRLEEGVARPLRDQAAALGINLETRLPVLRAFLNASTPGTVVMNQEQIWDSLLVLLRVLSAQRPLVLFIEDLHWSDADTARMFAYVARNIRELPILHLATMRPPDSGAADGARSDLSDLITQLRIEDSVEVVTLERLPEAESRKMVTSLFESHPPDPSWVDTIVEKTAGNPLFISELSKYVAGRSATETSAGPRADRLPFQSTPEKVRDLVAQRLKGLSDNDREILELASCESDDFDSETLTACLGMERLKLLRQLQGLAAKQRVIRHEGGRYRFDHPLIRETLYEGVLPELRSEYHRMLGAYHMERHGAAIEYASRIAHHLLESGQSQDAIAYLLTAAERAKELCANEEARRQYERLDSVLGDNPALAERDTQIRIALGYGDVLLAQGATREALVRLESGLELAVAAGRDDWQVDLRRRTVAAHRILGDLSQAEEAAKSALAAAQSLHDAQREVECLTTLAGIYVPRAEYEQTLSIGARAIAAAVKLGDVRNESIALSLIGTAHVHRGEYRAAVTVLEQAVERQRAIGDQRGLALSLNFAGLAYHRLARFSQALNCHQESLRVKKAIADVSTIPGSLNGLGDVHRDLWQLDEAIRFHSESLEMSRHHLNRGAECDNLRDLGADHLLRDDTQAAEPYLHEVLELSRRYGYPWYETRASITLGELYLLTDQGDLADEYSRDGLERAVRVGAKELAIEAQWVRARVVAHRGDATAGIQLLREAVQSAAASEFEQPLWNMYSDLAGLCEDSGYRSEALGWYAKALSHLQTTAATIDDPNLRAAYLASPRAQALRERAPRR
jgi:tetratricopeptide (TPR) repeat protein/predicted Ser/Thr protein kinase